MYRVVQANVRNNKIVILVILSSQVSYDIFQQPKKKTCLAAVTRCVLDLFSPFLFALYSTIKCEQTDELFRLALNSELP